MSIGSTFGREEITHPGSQVSGRQTAIDFDCPNGFEARMPQEHITSVKSI